MTSESAIKEEIELYLLRCKHEGYSINDALKAIFDLIYTPPKANWISVKDPQQPVQGTLYLIYGKQLNAHFPGMAPAVWDGEEWYDWDDHSYYYRENEVDYWLDLMKIPGPRV